MLQTAKMYQSLIDNEESTYIVGTSGVSEKDHMFITMSLEKAIKKYKELKKLYDTEEYRKYGYYDRVYLRRSLFEDDKYVEIGNIL